MRRTIRLAALAVAAAAGLVACGPAPVAWTSVSPERASRPSFRMTGSIEHLDLEGGVYVIQGDDSVTYAPTNLPAAFQYAGTRVEADARKSDQAMGIHQVGHPIELVRIRQR